MLKKCCFGRLNNCAFGQDNMDPYFVKSKSLWIYILIVSLKFGSSFTDIGKGSSQQNHFGGTSQYEFITKNNTRVVAQKGGLAVLPCVVKLNSPATVSWIRRKDFQLLTVGLSTHSSDKRFLVEHTRHMGHWSLRIKSVREDDKGFYECQLSIYPTQSIFIELKVVEAIAEIIGTSDLHIDEGSTLKLECELRRATENPAFVFWYHNNKMINYDTQGGFHVTSVAKKPIEMNETSTGRKDLTKAYKSSSSQKYSNNSINFQRNLNTLSSSTTNQHSSALSSALSISILSIRQVHFHHAGNYTCAPSNARSASITVHVLRGEKPAAMQHANKSIFDGEIGNNSYPTSSANRTTSYRFFLHNYLSLLISVCYLKFCIYGASYKKTHFS